MTKLIHSRVIVLASFYPADLASEPKTETTRIKETTAEKNIRKLTLRHTDEVKMIALIESFHWKQKL